MSLSLDTPTLFWIACGAFAVITAVLAARHKLKTSNSCLLLAGIIMLVIAAGSPRITWHKAEAVVVRVDLSPSTRTATFRSRNYLTGRIATLLGDTPYRIEYFPNGLAKSAEDAAVLPDIPCEQTAFPAADSVTLLFSDCRFELPVNAPPTYIVVDSALENPGDGAVTNIETLDHQAWVSTRITDRTRTLALSGGTPSTAPAPIGLITHSLTVYRDASSITARLNAADPWPENDVLTSAVAPPTHAEKWWIGSPPAPAGWRQFSPSDLPATSGSYLGASVIVIANVRADEIDGTRQECLSQYVRILGGVLLILGGDQAFGPGGYFNTRLDSLSPLASNPPATSTQWVILVDSSGSMSSPAAGATRWTVASQAAVKLLPRIPPTDSVSIGAFSDAITWWAQSRADAEIIRLSLPPPGAAPHGPTNLQPAIQNVINSVRDNLPTNLLIISDFDATLTETVSLAKALREKHMRLDLLAIGHGNALEAMRQISTQTGGHTLLSDDPAQWAQSARDLLASALPGRFLKDSVSVAFTATPRPLPRTMTSAWDRTWLKSDATMLAQTTVDDETQPMAARWNIGQGSVLAVAFMPPAPIVNSLSETFAREPRDPEIRVSHTLGRDLIVVIQAMTGSQYLNDLHPVLELRDASQSETPVISREIPQTAAGAYSLRLPAPRTPQLADVLINGRVADRFAIAGRYAPEFDRIGNDRQAMDELARLTGGAVILPTQTAPIGISWPATRRSVTSLLAAVGVAIVAASLMLMRRTASP